MNKSMSHYRWVIIGFTFIAIIINYLDRTALSYAIEPIEATFNLSNTEFGAIAAAFGVGYMLMTILGGVLVDQYGSRRIWSGFAILWSIMCALLGLATGFWWVFVVRLFLGLSEAPTFPAFERVIADWLPMSERVRATALGLIAVPLASVLGAPFISYLIDSVGWKIMFFILGTLGIFWAIIWYIVFRDRPAQSQWVNASELQYIQERVDHVNLKPKENTPWRTILLDRSLIANNIGFIAFGYLLFFSITWLPGYLQQTYAIPLEQVGWILTLPWLTAAIFLFMGGVVSDWVWKKTKSIRYARSYLISISLLLSSLSFVPLIISHSLVVCLIGMSLGMGFGMMPNSAFYSINADLAHDHAATSLGVMVCLGAVSSILAPFLTGLLSSITGNFSAAIMLMSGLLFFASIIIFIFQHPDAVLNP